MPNVSDLSTGEKFDAFFRIRDLQKKETRNGRQYLDLVLEDRTGGISAKVWEVEEQVLGVIERGDFVKARAVVESYQGNFQLRIQKIRKVNDEDYEEGFRQEECIEQTPFDIDLMWEEIRRIARTCHPLVADFLISIFGQYEEKFKFWPAAQRIHHPYLGGLLEHTLSVTKTCIYLADKYEVFADLLVAAAMIHDIGKFDELSTSGGIEYTDEGRLIGHVVLGRDILRDHAKSYGELPGDFLLHLEHLILAHQGQLDWGTVKVPMTPEALLLHYADDIDAKFNIMKRAIEMDRGDESFTSRNSIMQRPFYKLRPQLPLAKNEETSADPADDPAPREGAPNTPAEWAESPSGSA
ncbi:MAG: HD domain-containing protein [Nitrospinota bacterium]